MGVSIIAVIDIGQNGCEIRVFPFLYQFVITALCPYFGTCREEELEFCVRENDRSDITTIHNDALCFAHLLLLRDEESTYFFDGGNLTCSVADLQRADLSLYIFAVQRHMLSTIYEYKTHLYLRQGRDDSRLVCQAVSQGEQGNRAVHRTGIHIGITGILGQRLSNRRFTARRIAVYRNNNLTHFSIEFMSNVIPAWYEKLDLVIWLSAKAIRTCLMRTPAPKEKPAKDRWSIRFNSARRRWL